MLKCISMLLKPTPNTSASAYGRTVILKNFVFVRQTYLARRMHLVTWDVNAVTGSKPTIQSNYRTSRIPTYCCPNHRRYASMFHSWNQAFRIIDVLGRSAWCGEQHEGRLVWPCYVFPVIRRPGFMIAILSFTLFSFVFSNQRFNNCSSTVDVGFVKLTSDCCEETGSSWWMLSFDVTCAAAVLWFLDIIIFSVRRFLSFSFGFRPLFLSADDVFPWSVYVVITLGTAALDIHLMKWPFDYRCCTKRAPTICSLWVSEKSPIFQYFHTNCYWHNL